MGAGGGGAAAAASAVATERRFLMREGEGDARLALCRRVSLVARGGVGGVKLGGVGKREGTGKNMYHIVSIGMRYLTP